MSEREYPDPDSISDEEEELDAQVGAKMRLFLDRMISTAYKEEGIAEERAIDILMCTMIQMYVEHYGTTPEEVSLFCKAIAKEIHRLPNDADVVH